MTIIEASDIIEVDVIGLTDNELQQIIDWLNN
jgi:hypothetical protein